MDLKTLLTKHKLLLKSVFIASATYLVFYSVLLNPNTIFWGSDAEYKFQPARNYLYEQIVENKTFPFWTERKLSGFPIYADLENGYLNLSNIIFTVLFDPVTGYKILHFLSYLIGSIGLYLFLKNKGYGLAGYATTNCIFFFSHFFTNHQIHTSLVMTLYFFPLSLYLLDQYLLDKRLRNILFSTLLFVHVFYWGHPQALIIYLMGFVTYAIVYYRDSFLSLFKYFFTVGLLSFLLILPQLVPSIALNMSSTRSIAGEEISANFGSYTPALVTLLGFPALFDTTDNFQGQGILKEYTVTELYVYVGISSLLLAVLGLIYAKDRKIVVYSLSLVALFLIFGFTKYIPIVDLDYIPIISFFRYWTRTAYLASFAVALLAGHFVNQVVSKDINLSKKAITVGAYILGAIAFLNIINLVNPLNNGILTAHVLQLFEKPGFVEWVFFAITTALLSYTVAFYSKNLTENVLKILQLLLVLIVLIDLRYFSQDLLNFRTQNVADLTKVSVSREFDNRRLVVTTDNIEDDEGLYYKHWSPFGYSQFSSKEYIEYFDDEGIQDIRKPLETDIESAPHDQYKDLGVYAIYDPNEEDAVKSVMYYSKDKPLDILDSDIPGKYLYKREGHIAMEVTSDIDQTIDTSIRTYTGWQLFIDGKKSALKDNELFYSFDLPAGTHTVELRYVPVHFYLGVLLSAGGILALLVLWKFYLKPRNLI